MNVTCQLLGGLGNMLFGIATTYAVGKEFNLTPTIDLKHQGWLHNHPKEYKNNIFRNLEVIDNSNDFFLYKEDSFNYKKIKIPINKNIKLYGYFQSEKYFLNYRDEILKLFSPTEDIVNYIYHKYGNIISNYECTSIHVRRGNYLNLSRVHPPCQLEYYKKGMEYFKKNKFLIFSDDIEYCKNNFIGDNFYFIENENDIVDLYLMSFCKNNIIANSSFSWWGAWLNNNTEKIVIYPTKWFGESVYNSHDICPSSWIGL